MVEFLQLVQEIALVQESVTPTPTQTHMPTQVGSALKPICHPTFRGGHKYLKRFDVTARTRVCGRNGNFQCSKDNNSRSMQSRVTVPALCKSSHSD